MTDRGSPLSPRLSFFGRHLFFGVGGLVATPVVIAVETATGASTTNAIFFGCVCAIWTLLGMIGRYGSPWRRLDG